MTPSPDLTIETPRCRLRRPTREDIPDILSATRFAGFNDGMLWDAPANEADLLAPLEETMRVWENGTAYHFTIERKPFIACIGRIGIRRRNEQHVWSIGFWTHPAHQGQGIMSEVAPAVLDLGFRQLGAIRIEACHALRNHASRRVLEKLGMTFVRYLPEGFQKQGKWVEENLYAISREDWENRRGSGHREDAGSVARQVVKDDLAGLVQANPAP